MICINNQLVEFIYFPDGTSTAKIQESNPNTITWLYDNDGELFQLYAVVKQIQRICNTPLTLCLPYVPNARMDRIHNSNEVFTLKYFADIINSLNFKQVEVLDVHSNVASALINNVKVNTIDELITNVLQKINEQVIFFFPDEGAMKRYEYLAQKFNIQYCFGMKKREWETGKIVSLDVINPFDIDLQNKNILIIDDICSKGGTFYYSAKALKQYGVNNVYLYVSHLENAVAEGDLIKSDYVNKIFATNSIFRTERHTQAVLDKICII